MAEGVTRVAVWVRFGTSELLQALIKAEGRRRKELVADPRWSGEGLPAAERAELRRARAAYLAGLRERGELLDMAGAVVAEGTRRELAARGWDRPWPAAPAELDLAGRWWGAQSHGYPERVGASLAPALVRKVRAACWHTSSEAITALQVWREDHPGPISKDDPAYAEYLELAARITTPGDIWRQALDHMLGRPPGAEDS